MSTSIVVDPTLLEEKQEDSALSLLCWQCRTPLGPIAAVPVTGCATLQCRSCNAVTLCRDGLWCSLAPATLQRFHRFIHDYEFIRAAEGRGSTDEDYYLNLPYKDLSGRNSDQWSIRARSFRHIERTIIEPLTALRKRPLRILDLGAGNGWMSYRLALCGHLPVAVDLLINDHDGLGAGVHFNRKLRQPFPRVQAELDHLPFASSTFDLAIFNASFHYSEDYGRTFAEALRCTRVGGVVLIADTPWYAQEASGTRMVEEKRAHFAARYGFPSDSIESLEFLTPDRLQTLQNSFTAKWSVSRPFYGIRWFLRPLIAKLRRRRTPSRFFVYAAWVAE